jgi:hypothetical protein
VAAALEKGVVMEKSDGFAVSARELLVALPILGTTLAITYDVGFFYGIDIGYFTLFSLAEHIVFALEAIPAAFVGALMVPMGIFSWQLGERALEKARGPITAETPAEERERIQARLDARQKRMDRWHLSFSVCVLALGILLFIISKELLFAPAAIVAGLYGLTGYVFPPKEYFRNPAYFAGTFYTIMFIVTAFSLGLFSAHRYVSDSPPTTSIAINGAIGELKGRLIRSGDRGVMFFDTNAKRVDFLMWGNIKGIQMLGTVPPAPMR